MDIFWKTESLKKGLEDGDSLVKKYDKKIARNIAKRLVEIKNAPHYGHLPSSSGKHSIREGSKFLYFAVDVPGVGSGRGSLRLIFRPRNGCDISRVETITEVTILGLENYHKG